MLGVGVLRVTPAAGPGVVVAVMSRAAVHCVTGFRRRGETFGRLDPEHLVGMLGWRNPPGEQFSTSSSYKKKPAAAVPISVNGSIS
jgi:hypothetical protein